MRTKTLLLSAVALVAGIATSQAQVYSQNVVGYATLTLSPGNFDLVAPTLDADGTGKNGTINSVLGTNCASATTVYVFNGIAYDILTYTSGNPGRGLPAEWTFNGNADNTYPLNVGEGFWINDPSDTSVTLVGNVLQGTLTNTAIPTQNNFGLISDQVPLSGGLTSVLGYQPSSADAVYLYNGSSYNIYTYTSGNPGRGLPAEWTFNGSSNEPQISVGQGFWLDPAGATPSWTQSFTVN